MQGVAHREISEDRGLPMFSDAAAEEDAAVADVLHGPAAVVGEEGEGEIGGGGDRADGGGGG